MNRSELIAAVAAGTGGDQADVRRYVDAVFNTIISSVAAGEKVVVTGFGTFDRLARPARTVRNPRTGQSKDLGPSHAPRFSVGRTFKERVSGAEAVPVVTDVIPAAAETEPAKAEKTSKRKTDAAAKAEPKRGKASLKTTSLKTTSKKAKGNKPAKAPKAPKAAKSRKPGRDMASASKKATAKTTRSK